MLRSLNRNLSTNTGNLEAHIEELKLKLAAKISLLAERKAEIDSCRNNIDLMKSEQLRLRIERDELVKTVDVQEQIMANITSLQSGAGLADHFYRSQTETKIARLDQLAEQRLCEINDKAQQISTLIGQLDECRAAIAVQPQKTDVTTCSDNSCQVDLPPSELISDEATGLDVVVVVPDCSALQDLMDNVADLQRQLNDERVAAEHEMELLRSTNDKYEVDVKDLSQKCEFFETQIGLQEKARQEMLSENIKLTEEAHNLNAALKLHLSQCRDELAHVKVRLTEAEQVERTVQVVIDKYVRESSEAKAKYKRELTLHAADSKLLEAANREVARLQQLDRSVDDQCNKLRFELSQSTDRWSQRLTDLQQRYDELETQKRHSDDNNERLYDQLQSLNNDNSSFASYQEIIEDLRNQINIGKASSSLSSVQIERYDNEIAQLRDELHDMRHQSDIVIDRLNKSQTLEDNASSVTALDAAVIRESNHMLRQQKEHLERLLITQAAELDKLSDQSDKLQSSVSELTEEKSVLMKNKDDLDEEKNRWKDRCTKLVERAEQMDPEQYKNACNDRDKLRKQVHELEMRLEETRASLEISR